jgi:hypothetical protein
MSERAYHDNGAADAPVVTRERLSVAAVVRAVLTIASVAALAIGAFMDWINETTGDHLAFDAYWRSPTATTGALFRSAAVLMIGIAVAGLLALAFRGGWLLRLAGAVGLVGVLLLFVQMGRAEMSILDATEEGLWLCLAGAAGLLIAGFVPTTTVVAARRPPDRRDDEYV